MSPLQAPAPATPSYQQSPLKPLHNDPHFASLSGGPPAIIAPTPEETANFADAWVGYHEHFMEIDPVALNALIAETDGLVDGQAPQQQPQQQQLLLQQPEQQPEQHQPHQPQQQQQQQPLPQQPEQHQQHQPQQLPAQWQPDPASIRHVIPTIHPDDLEFRRERLTAIYDDVRNVWMEKALGTGDERQWAHDTLRNAHDAIQGAAADVHRLKDLPDAVKELLAGQGSMVENQTQVLQKLGQMGQAGGDQMEILREIRDTMHNLLQRESHRDAATALIGLSAPSPAAASSPQTSGSRPSGKAPARGARADPKARHPSKSAVSAAKQRLPSSKPIGGGSILDMKFTKTCKGKHVLSFLLQSVGNRSLVQNSGAIVRVHQVLQPAFLKFLSQRKVPDVTSSAANLAIIKFSQAFENNPERYTEEILGTRKATSSEQEHLKSVIRIVQAFKKEKEFRVVGWSWVDEGAMDYGSETSESDGSFSSDSSSTSEDEGGPSDQ
jgi:hypothetical protein